jgi:PTH1 family peptidyl-tRNA hydrolase
MKLIVGLGNPGQKYKGTRHNIGFDVLAEIGRRFGFGLPRSKFNAEIAETVVQNEKLILLSPLTFMNLSGQSVRASVDFYKLDLADLIVVCDDLALSVGRLRIRPSGSAGGQKGLKDIINRLGTQEFARLRVGIGGPPPGWDAADYVLGKFNKEEKPEIEKAIGRAADAVEIWTTQGVQQAMNRFNADPKAPPKPETKKQSQTESERDK